MDRLTWRQMIHYFRAAERRRVREMELHLALTLRSAL